MTLKTALLIGVLGGVNLSAGQINGTVTVRRKLTRTRITSVAYQPRGPVTPQDITDPVPSSETRRMVVYLDGHNLPAPAETVNETMRQKNRQFTPEIVVLPVGSTLTLPNDDPIFHNVFSLSRASLFDLGYYPKGQSRTLIMSKAGIVQLYCHMHKEMSAAVIVTPSQWYTRVADNGEFQFSDVPAGTYDLVVWHKSAGFFRRKIKVPESGGVGLTIDVPTAALAPPTSTTASQTDVTK